MAKIIAIIFVLSLLLGCAEKPQTTYIHEVITDHCYKLTDSTDVETFEWIDCKDVPKDRWLIRVREISPGEDE